MKKAKKYDVVRITKDGNLKIYLRGWTAKKLAEKLDVDLSTIYRDAVNKSCLLKKYYVRETDK